MEWRLQAYGQLHLDERVKGKSRPEPSLSRCKVLSFFGNTVNSSNEAAMVDQELGVWLDGAKVRRSGNSTSPIQNGLQQKKESDPGRDGFSLL